MIKLGFKVNYVHLMGKQYLDRAGLKYFTDFKMKGVEFIKFNYEYWWNFRNSQQAKDYCKTLIDSLQLNHRKFDFIYIAFWYIADYFIDLIKNQVPEVPILIDTMDLHYLREIRQAEAKKDKNLLNIALENKKRELNVYSKADCVTTVTLKDRDELKKEIDKPIFILTDVHEINDNTPSFKERKDLVFVGNFNHNPNEDAVIYFVKEIFLYIKMKIPNIKFYVVGNNPTDKIKSLASNDIIVTGWVPDVKEYLNKCRVEIVPLRFGAGNKGKVGEALANGIPLVTTSIGAEGMGIINEEHAFVSDDPKTFAEFVIKLYNDETLWNKFSNKGKELVASQYSSELMRKRLGYIFNYNKKTLKSYQAKQYPEPPIISIILIAYNQFNYTLKCLKSIKENVKVSHEIILIDNASSDETKTAFKNEINYVRYFRNQTNLGFPTAVNQGITQAIGKYILILNNDTILTENLIERMIEVAESDEKIGLVGPLSNEVSGLQKDENANYNSIEEMFRYAEQLKEKNKGQIFHFPRVAFLCTLIKKEVIEKIGGLDERFSPGNYEDDDFCLRAQFVGFKTVIIKDAFIHHFGSKSFKADGIKAYSDRLETN
jgi:GT2 family glycosyltransferase/glycosyltransferase involved in cell wall biosynthesis